MVGEGNMSHAGILKSGERRYKSRYESAQRKGYTGGFYEWKKENGLLDSVRMVIYI